MQILEFHFNPKNKEDSIFDTFAYEPENLYEKNLGNLYVVGELTKILNKDSRFLNNLAEIIKKEFYSSGLKKNSETSLRDALKKANEYLDRQSKEGNIDWLGNLNFGILNINGYASNLAKTGNIKILLIRQAEVIDLSQNLESQLKDPLKTFGNIATGKLADSDKIIILTKEVYAVVHKNKSFLKELVSASGEREIKEVFRLKKDLFLGLCGACLIVIANQENRQRDSVILQRGPISFSFKKTFGAPALKIKKKLRMPRFKIAFRLPEINLPKIKGFKVLKIKTPKIKALPSFKVPRISFHMPKVSLTKESAKKKLVPVLLLILLLSVCFLIFSNEKRNALEAAKQKIALAQEKITLAQNLLILKENEKARTLLQETLDVLAPLAKAGMPQRNEARDLQKSVQEYLDANF
jgi:hypothetical protein